MEEEEIKEKQITFLELQKIWIEKKGWIVREDLQKFILSFLELIEAIEWWGEKNKVKIIDRELKRIVYGENGIEGVVKIYYT